MGRRADPPFHDVHGHRYSYIHQSARYSFNLSGKLSVMASAPDSAGLWNSFTGIPIQHTQQPVRLGFPPWTCSRKRIWSQGPRRFHPIFWIRCLPQVILRLSPISAVMDSSPASIYHLRVAQAPEGLTSRSGFIITGCISK